MNWQNIKMYDSRQSDFVDRKFYDMLCGIARMEGIDYRIILSESDGGECAPPNSHDERGILFIGIGRRNEHKKDKTGTFVLFLHELAHAIDFEKNGDKENFHDGEFVEINDRLVYRYMVMKPDLLKEYELR